MALILATLETDINNAFKALYANTTDKPEVAQQKFAKLLAVAIDKYIKSAQVAPGIPVSTTGTPSAQTGATTAPGTLM